MESLPADAVAKLIADIFAAVSRMLNDILMAFLIAFAAPGPQVGDDSDTDEAEEETQRTDPEKSVNMGKILLKMQHGVCEEHYSPGEDKGEENISPVTMPGQESPESGTDSDHFSPPTPLPVPSPPSPPWRQRKPLPIR